MAEYIERKDLLELYRMDDPVLNENGHVPLPVIRQNIMDIPAADVAPVVHCKDCKYWQDNNDGYPHEECRWGHGETPDANDFCSYGEQKEGDD